MGSRIVLASVGSYGDLHPFIAVALTLKARGFEPVIAASEAYRGKVEAEGLAFHAVRPSPEQLLRDAGLDEAALAQVVLKSGTTRLIDFTVLPYIEQSYADFSEAMQGAQALLASSFAIIARLAAEKAGAPVVSLLLSPIAFFSLAEPPLLMELPWLQGFQRRFGARPAKAILDLGRVSFSRRTRPVAALRRRLGLPPARGDEVMDGPLRADRVVGGYSPVLGELAPDAPPGSVLAGFTFYDSEGGGPPRLPQHLADFLDAGPPPLVFSLGTLAVQAAGEFYDEAAEAARRLGRRAVLLVGGDHEARLAARLSSADICVAGYAPYSLVFPRAVACIHHGGIGGVAQALRAGCPQLIHPLCGDQADNAQRLTRLGVAHTLGGRRFTATRVAAALEKLVADKALAARAAGLARQVSQEDGAARVADILAEVVAARAQAFSPNTSNTAAP